jgi:hypothetical protein
LLLLFDCSCCWARARTKSTEDSKFPLQFATISIIISILVSGNHSARFRTYCSKKNKK